MLCVGETLAEREADQTEAVVGRQLQAVLDVVGIEAFATIVVAYEPVWAIGTGKTASPEQAQAVHAFIRGLLAQASESVAGKCRVLYGGSVKASSAQELFQQPDIDGGLVGHHCSPTSLLRSVRLRKGFNEWLSKIWCWWFMFCWVWVLSVSY